MIEIIRTFPQLFPSLKIVEHNYIPGSFFDHVDIRDGVICFDDDVEIQCLLHEIAHLALLPAEIRERIDDDVDFKVEEINQHKKFYFTGNEDHLIVWQKLVTEQLGLPEICKYVEDGDEGYYPQINREYVAAIFNRLGMGFDPIANSFQYIVSPL